MRALVHHKPARDLPEAGQVPGNHLLWLREVSCSEEDRASFSKEYQYRCLPVILTLSPDWHFHRQASQRALALQRQGHLAKSVREQTLSIPMQ